MTVDGTRAPHVGKWIPHVSSRLLGPLGVVAPALKPLQTTETQDISRLLRFTGQDGDSDPLETHSRPDPDGQTHVPQGAPWTGQSGLNNHTGLCLALLFASFCFSGQTASTHLHIITRPCPVLKLLVIHDFSMDSPVILELNCLP